MFEILSSRTGKGQDETQAFMRAHKGGTTLPIIVSRRLQIRGDGVMVEPDYGFRTTEGGAVNLGAEAPSSSAAPINAYRKSSSLAIATCNHPRMSPVYLNTSLACSSMADGPSCTAETNRRSMPLRRAATMSRVQLWNRSGVACSAETPRRTREGRSVMSPERLKAQGCKL